jgi:hypothetical protein
MADFGLAEIGAVAGLAGAATSAVGTIGGGISAGRQANYGAQVAANNAIVASQNAARAEAAGARQATDVSMRGAVTGGEIKAAQAANNIDVNTGSAVDVQVGERETTQLSAMTAENDALLKAYGYRAAATSFGAQSGLEKTEAAQAPIGAGLAASGGLLGSASALAYKWKAFQPGANTGIGNLTTDQIVALGGT